MNYKGFTLVELLAVIVIVALLLGLSSGVFIQVRHNVLEAQYENVVNKLLSDAEDYADDLKSTEPIDISVDFLIKNGYSLPDDENNIYDPRDKNNILNCYMIHVYLKDNEYVAEWKDKEELADGTCNENKINTNELQIYCNGVECSSNWYNTNVTLSLHGLNSDILNNSEVEWTNLNGMYTLRKSGEDKNFLVETDGVIKTTYNVQVKTSDKIYTASVSIKIDKENPLLIKESLPITYDGKEYLSIEASDQSGSGYKGFAISSNNCQNEKYTTGKYEVAKSGKYALCLQDNAGNITKKNIEIKKVTFNYNDLSNSQVTKKEAFFLTTDANQALLVPDRVGYDFSYWYKNTDERVYEFRGLENNAELMAKWNFQDLDISVDKIDKKTVGVEIRNKINMILVLDVSGSMEGANITNLKKVSNNLINGMAFDLGSTISIISFESYASTLLNAGTSAEKAHDVISSVYATNGGTSFINALDKANYLINQNFNDNTFDSKENTYMIFVSDGDANDNVLDISNAIKSQIQKVYSIGIGDTDTTRLKTIASPDSYFHSSSGLDSLQEIFTTIQKEVREEVKVKSQAGLIKLPNLYVSSDFPFILNINKKEYTYNSVSGLTPIITKVNDTYYLDLNKVDIVYKLNGDLTNVDFVYYYE